MAFRQGAVSCSRNKLVISAKEPTIKFMGIEGSRLETTKWQAQSDAHDDLELNLSRSNSLGNRVITALATRAQRLGPAGLRRHYYAERARSRARSQGKEHHPRGLRTPPLALRHR